MKRRIAIVTNIPSPYRVDLFCYMQSHFNGEVFIIYTNANEDNRNWSIETEKLVNSYILSSPIIKIRGENDNRYIHFPANIGKVLSHILPEIVIAFEYNPAALQSLIWCKKNRKKFIHLTDGTLYSERNISKIQKLTRKVIISNADAYIASSTKAKEKLLAWGALKQKIFVSLLTVDIEQYKSIERKPEKGRILYVGSLIKRKGLDLLFDALGKVNLEYELRIVGNGTPIEINELKKIADKKNITSKIHWCGYKEKKELMEEYKKAELFVFPTREDCFGLVLLEALVSKIPIISSKYADGSYDIVKVGKNGYLVDPYNVEEFSAAILKCLNNPDLQNNALNMDCGKFEFEATLQGYIDAIEYVVR